MKKILQFFRLLKIQYVLMIYGMDDLVFAIPFFSAFRFLTYLNPWKRFYTKKMSRSQRLRLALIALGPIFVKFGQTLSTRSDLLPADIIAELSLLQDRVPPFSTEEAIKIIEEQYAAPIMEVFAKFDPTPTASASIAQVHEVELKEGQRAIIKILRPNIEKIIDRDIALLYMFVRLIQRYWRGADRLHPIEIITEFDKIIHDELDLMREAANASQLRRNFLNSDSLYIPEIYWPYARDRVIAMEYVSGIPIADIDRLRAHQIDLKKLAERGVEIFFTQVFRDSFFHADMHPGNIFVNPNYPDNPQYIAVDFGIMGTLSPDDQRYLAYNILAFFKRDYRRVALLHIESGWVPENTRVNEFEAAIRTVSEPIFGRPLKEISFGRTLMRLFQIGRQFHMEVQPQLVLLQKTLLHIEGLGRRLYPDLDLWSTAKPFLEDWLKKHIGPKAFAKKIKENLPAWSEQWPEIPSLLYNTLEQLTTLNKIQLQQKKQEDKIGLRVNRMRWRWYLWGLATGALLIIIINLALNS